MLSRCCGFKAVAYRSSSHYINCSHLKNKEQFKELKRRRRKAEIGNRYEKKKCKIVMGELAIMNSFLIPLLHMLVIIP